ncbi:MAG: hypothetical protein JXN65_11955 [Clostridia bacterium]|nr:hypothetical protein [Clostridia bacterium]
MFFTPLWFYLKQLFTTLIVEVGLFYMLVSKKPINVISAATFNVFTHISLNIFFSYMLLSQIGYNIYVYIFGEAMVTFIEAVLYYISKCIPKFKRAVFFSMIFNIASIVVGQIINLILGL